ncbi:hypothetical protein [Actinomyces culturomici]|uniref:hypothetical protein n=1 Tax=Actinomyces culturomici TaxID=1926276 RepID=UPI000E205765|nr:hypothetical protein [Actinomyces culturomici]
MPEFSVSNEQDLIHRLFAPDQPKPKEFEIKDVAPLEVADPAPSPDPEPATPKGPDATEGADDEALSQTEAIEANDPEDPAPDSADSADSAEATEGPEGPETVGTDRASREAAKYRTRLRETEKKLATAQSMYNALIRQIVISQLPDYITERLLSKELDGDFSTLLNVDGTVNKQAISETFERMRKDYKLGPQDVYVSGISSAPSTGTFESASWYSVFTDRDVEF